MMRKGVVAFGVVLALGVAVGCGDEASCPEGYVEEAGRCVLPEDAGAEGGRSDGQVPDAEAPDDAGRDAGQPLPEAGPDGCTLQRWYLDSDEDGYGDPEAVTEACERPAGHVDNAEDCDDRCPDCFPGGSETCDDRDNDCDGTTDEDFADKGTSCTVGTGACARDGAMVCTADGSGTECDATPGARGTETCNGVDDDCDGTTDEPDAVDAPTWYLDMDGDGYGRAGTTMRACTMPEGYVDNADDCDDGRGRVNPGAAEVCNGRDDDCDGATDEDPTAGEPALCSDPATPVCYDGSCLCRPQVTGISGNYALLVPGGSYVVCGSCLGEVNRVRIGGVNVPATTAPGYCSGGTDGARFTVPSGIGGNVNLYAAVIGQGRLSDPYRVTVGELRVNEVKAGAGLYEGAEDYVELCVVDPRNRATGLAAVPLDGYWFAVYQSDGARTINRSLAGKETAAGGCFAIGHAPNIPVTYGATNTIQLADTTVLPADVGGVVVARGAQRTTASSLANSQIVDAMIYDANWITSGTPPAALSNLLNSGSAQIVPVSQSQLGSWFARCGTYRDNLRDGRAWVVDRPLTLGTLANDCP